MYKTRKNKMAFIVPFVLFSCGIASIAYPEPKAKNSFAKVTVEEQVQDTLELLLKQVLTQLNSIDSILEELALLVNNDQLAKGGNKKEIISSIRSLRSLIDTIRSDTFVTIDLQSIYLMLKLNNALMNTIGKALLNGFYELPPFNLEEHITKHLRTPAGLDTVTQTLTANNKKLEALTELSKGAGLKWYNHLYRSFDQTVLQPAQKYKLGTIATLAATSAALLWWYTDSKLFPVLRKTLHLGWRPHVDKLGNLDEGHLKDHPLEVGGRLERWYHEYNTMLYAPLAVPLMWASSKNSIDAARFWLKKRVKKSINHLKGGINETEYEGIMKKNPDIDFSNIIGNEAAKAEGWKVVKYMEDPERYDRFKMQVERGILLIGKTRTGKTYFAEALAGEIKKVMKKQGRNTAELGFYNIKASLIAKHGIEYVLNLAKKEAPCVLFIDEIDLLALQRVGGDRDTLYAFLTSMSGCFERDLDKRVIIIGATNNPQNLDRALKARGRFGMILEFTYPEFRERKACLEKHLNALTLNVKAFDLDKLARETEGCSYEALLAIVREAFLQAKIKGAVINQDLLEKALDTTVRNIVFENQKEVPEHEHAIIAAHMAGHAVVTTLLPTSKKLAKVTTLPVLTEIEEEAIWDTYSKKDKDTTNQKDKDARITQYGQLFTYHDQDTLSLTDETEKLRQCTAELAGHIAEKLLLGSCGYSYHPDDSQKAYALVKAIAFRGLKESDLSEAEADRRKDDALALLKKCEADAVRLLEQNKPALERVAHALAENRILTAEQVQALMHDLPTLATHAMPGMQHDAQEENEVPQTSTSNTRNAN